MADAFEHCLQTTETDLDFFLPRSFAQEFCQFFGFLRSRAVIAFHIPIFIFHVFYDEAYYISLQEAVDLINSGIILPTEQTFYAPGGATTHKHIYKIWYTLAHPLGTMVCEPEMSAKFVQDKNGHILPYVHFSGGEMTLSVDILTELRSRM